MAHVRIQFSERDSVLVNLPSRKRGNAGVFVGKAKAQIGCLKCSQEIEVTKEALSVFFQQVRRADGSLVGEFHLNSVCTTFALSGEADSKGRIRIKVAFRYFRFDQPENVEWRASGESSVATRIV